MHQRAAWSCVDSCERRKVGRMRCMRSFVVVGGGDAIGGRLAHGAPIPGAARVSGRRSQAEWRAKASQHCFVFRVP
eukprot:5241786-Prymnesium_polylepis.1